MFANAAEIMRWEGGWVEEGAKASGGSGFSNQLYWLFARQSIIIGQANYGMVSIKALLAFSVYLDDVSMVRSVFRFNRDLGFLTLLSTIMPSTHIKTTSVLAYTATTTHKQVKAPKQVEIKATPSLVLAGPLLPHV